MPLALGGVPAESPDIGDRFSLGGMEIRVLGPQRVYDDMNDNSILLKMTYGEISFLFMGDAEENAEKDLLAFGDNLYRMPERMPGVKGLKVLRPGLHLGTMKKGGLNRHMRWHFRFRPKIAVHCCNLSGDSQEARQ